MLTEKEAEILARVRAVYSAALEGRETDLKGSIDDVLSLCDAVKRLARLKPGEFDFPQFIGLADQAKMQAYAMKYVGLAPAEKIHAWTEGPGRTTGLEFVGACEVYEAYVCARPYIEVLEPRLADALEEMRKTRVSILVDDKIAVVRKAPVEQFLIGPDGYGVLRKPFSFAGIVPRGLMCVMTLSSDDNRPEARPPELGLGIRNTERLRIELDDLPRRPMRIRVGAVIALYTTKDPTVVDRLGKAP